MARLPTLKLKRYGRTTPLRSVACRDRVGICSSAAPPCWPLGEEAFNLRRRRCPPPGLQLYKPAEPPSSSTARDTLGRAGERAVSAASLKQPARKKGERERERERGGGLRDSHCDSATRHTHETPTKGKKKKKACAKEIAQSVDHKETNMKQKGAHERKKEKERERERAHGRARGSI